MTTLQHLIISHQKLILFYIMWFMCFCLSNHVKQVLFWNLIYCYFLMVSCWLIGIGTEADVDEWTVVLSCLGSVLWTLIHGFKVLKSVFSSSHFTMFHCVSLSSLFWPWKAMSATAAVAVVKFAHVIELFYHLNYRTAIHNFWFKIDGSYLCHNFFLVALCLHFVLFARCERRYH